jgi:hypothetical protein
MRSPTRSRRRENSLDSPPDYPNEELMFLWSALADIRPLFELKARAKSLDPSAFAQRFDDIIERDGQRWSTEMSEHVAENQRASMTSCGPFDGSFGRQGYSSP